MSRDLRAASRRFEAMLWPTREEDLYQTPEPTGTVAAVYYLEKDIAGEPQIIVRSPDEQEGAP